MLFRSRLLIALEGAAQPYVLTAAEDAQALGHTLATLLHGGDALVAPWARTDAIATNVAEKRQQWYFDHAEVAPACPCPLPCLQGRSRRRRVAEAPGRRTK